MKGNKLKTVGSYLTAWDVIALDRIICLHAHQIMEGNDGNQNEVFSDGESRKGASQ